MNENLNNLIKALAENDELQEKLKNAESLEQVYEVALTIESGYTFEEFKDAMISLKVAPEEEEISDDDLEKVAGGKKYYEYEKSDIGETLLSYLTLGIG